MPKIDIWFVHVATGVRCLVTVTKREDGGARVHFSLRDEIGFNPDFAERELKRWTDWGASFADEPPDGWIHL